jgi:predicted lipid-binding transport protein (Tim44 family)
MRVGSISTYQASSLRNTNKVYKNETHFLKTNDSTEKNQVAFKGTLGKLLGGTVGVFGAGFLTLATLTPAGLAVAAVAIAADIGGAVVGAAIGDAIEGKDEDEDDNNK